ncbi:phosphoglucosamine mutase [Oceanicaulis alexandrii]|uniref:phosphoglucosamine mutase n=1 Tax=Oceanicaulis alexandrii TaxID=153233 RepID=UPI0003B5E3FE|nr:phosphoglucosamine mutase [Oceanicaulis alexandrii]
MMKAFFGTDGIRGRTNSGAMTPESVLLLGRAAAAYFLRSGPQRKTVVIGKDTRLSGYMIENALTAGFTSAGMDVDLFGPLPTPGVASLTRSLRADLGVMITASHNPYEDNGIKLFGPDGFKLNDEAELEIEALMQGRTSIAHSPPSKIGRAKRVDDAEARYVEIVKATFPRQMRLSGLRVVVDCANGAAYKVAPRVLWELGADVIPINNQPNGLNINEDCGAIAPEGLAAQVLKFRADLGIALDGDADRLILCDEHGKIVDGDQLMGLLALEWKKSGKLAGDRIVTTVMSNMGLETELAKHGISLERTKVGDRHVVEAMRKGASNLGGEQSGHIVLTDYATTGDALIAALQVLSLLVEANKPASELLNVYKPAPQLLKNVRFELGAKPLETEAVKTAIANAEAMLKAKGRVLVRASGTEPVIRVMAEGPATKIKTAVQQICEAIEGRVQAAAE